MSALNPSAQEWKPLHPNPPSPIIILPAPPPLLPCPAAPAVAFVAPPHPLHPNHAFYFLGFVPFPQLPPSLPISGGEEKITFSPATAEKSRFPPRGRRPNTERIGIVKADPRQRLEWRPKIAAADGAASELPPQDLPRSAAPGGKLIWRTTVMIRNVPNQIRRDGMLKFLDNCCKKLSLEYNFLYLPMDFWSEDNLGYAFVNFTNTKAAVKFKKSLNNYKWGVIETPKGRYTTYKVCEVSWAAIQGKEGLMQKFENTKFGCDNSDFLPVEFDPPRNGSNAYLSPPKVVGVMRRRT